MYTGTSTLNTNMDVFNHLDIMHHFQTQLDGTNIAINYLLEKGYSLSVLKPYTNHVEYLTEMIDRMWSEFKTSVDNDKDRIDFNLSISWRPVTGIHYQELVNDENFIKRWK